jgi:hypothetical protein
VRNGEVLSPIPFESILTGACKQAGRIDEI